jgi:hypothetical protein
MEIKSLDNNNIIAEACCGENCLLKRAGLTDAEHTRLRAAQIKAQWLKKMIPRGLSAKIAYDGEDAVGFIEYMPIELSNFRKGKDLYIINCMRASHASPWGNTNRKRIPGCGSALAQAMMDEVSGKCRGIVTPEGFGYTEDMRRFFRKFGFEEFENDGLKMLIKKFGAVELPSRITYENKFYYRAIPGKLVIDIFWSSACPVIGPLQLLNVKKVAGQFDNKVVINDIRTDDKEVLMKYGVDPFTSLSTIFFNGKPMFCHPGPTDEAEMRHALQKFLQFEKI